MQIWDPFAEAASRGPESLRLDGVAIRRGSRVRIAPRRRSDILDMAMAGQAAVVESIEQDLEGRIQVAVILDADPGRELGAMRQPGHRFFFAPEELQPVDRTSPLRTAPRILLAGVGNVFLGDDGFGVALAARLGAETWADGVPDGVEIHDYGIRGFDLALALLEPWDHIVLLDAAPRGGAAGTVYWEEIAASETRAGTGVTEPHGLTPEAVLGLAAQLGAPPRTVWLAGCEPVAAPKECRSPEAEDRAELSPAVAAALPVAAALVRRRVEEWGSKWLCRQTARPEGRSE